MGKKWFHLFPTFCEAESLVIAERVAVIDPLQSH